MKESDLDKILKEYGIDPVICHIPVGKFVDKITVVVDNSRSRYDVTNTQVHKWVEDKINTIVSEISLKEDSPLTPIETITVALNRSNIYGYALCSLTDQFSRKKGRMIAKGRLISYIQKLRSINE